LIRTREKLAALRVGRRSLPGMYPDADGLYLRRGWERSHVESRVDAGETSHADRREAIMTGGNRKIA
jgi:hypothetical protein